ncbi:MAG TPA: hypothetical protein VIV06_10360, partial [Candidatus Limnocylindrales bacterium]
LDGSGPGAVVSRGSPFYFDWIEPDRLLAHVGVGTDALLGEIRLDGTPAAPAVHSPGVFNAPVMSADRNYIGYVRALAADGADNASDFAAQVVLASRDGSSEHTMPEFGVAAVAFDPSGDRIASIGATDEASSRLAIPFGPLRVMDAQSGTERTLLDGSVFAFWWSPDGRTIAALRVQTALDAPSKSPLPSPTSDTREIRLLFVDVASGNITSEALVDLGPLFINQLLMYFDQYTLSHHLWAPDSSSILVPVVDAGGATRVAVMFRNGDPPAMIDGAIGFWSP